MTPTKFRKALYAVGLDNPVRAAEFFGAYERSVRRWTHGESPVPQPVSMLLEIMLAENISASRADQIIRNAK